MSRVDESKVDLAQMLESIGFISGTPYRSFRAHIVKQSALVKPSVMKWYPYNRLRRDIPAPLQPWLCDSGSLTERLVAKSNGRFRVVVLRQQWGRARIDECRTLGIEPRHRVLLREVLLLGNEQPWVYARSVLPSSSLGRKLRHLRRLGTRPLGALLFNDPHTQRGIIEVAHWRSEDLPRRVASLWVGEPFVLDPGAWGRRSVFLLKGQPLLVAEVFLPGFTP